MKRFLNNFLLFIQFFTRIPINKNLQCENKNFREGAIFFPVIGLIIGIIQFCIASIFSKWIPINITAVLVVLSSVIITGALHLDGLGDLCDGFYAFKGGKDKIIEIMKDSTIGTFAGAAIVFDILLKYTIIENLISYRTFNFIIIIPVISRFTIVLLAYIGKNAKETGTGNIFIGNIDGKTLIKTLAITVILSFAFIGLIRTFIVIILSAFLTILFNKYCEFKIQGLTGDLLGANNEIIEIFVGIMLVVLL
ncbi:adenosylcobinamide-GDP ribazoletransferase [Clostridium grantii]|uniref:Adenosylcobinamide-GDP ribazoletransferase n=1 Tax=Clostridium grantii DSM 8605 TaxID=1121316 RepID=A0A1M5WCW8_9CLOT|nr:adenosylcobinamide-GDP ribazoletransferase [Clostridium grantii]SHH85287.1 cobalamin-5'-phosphate synthase [Clostridium grantii DSM 8605]